MVTDALQGAKGAAPLGTDADRDQAALRKACQDFEAFLVSYLLRQMWQAAESVGEEKPFVHTAYRDLFTFEFAQALTPSLRWGIADALYRELAELTPPVSASEQAQRR